MRTRIVVVGAAILLLVAACGNSGSSKQSESTIPKSGATTTTISAEDLKKNVPVTAPGVTDKQINVNAVITESNSPTGSFGPLADGIRAYFEMINSNGGIYGRQLKLTKTYDDQLGQNAQAVRAALTDKPFATFIAAVLFTGAPLLARANQPTFTWNINPEFAGKNNFFANKGALCFKCEGHVLPWLAKQLGATKIGIIAYGVSQESTECADGLSNTYAKYGGPAKVVFKDKSLPFAANLSSDVSAMKRAGVQFIHTCVDLGESFALGKEMKRQGLNAVQTLPNGYDPEFVKKNADALDGSIIGPQFVAFEHEPQIDEVKKLFEWTNKIGVPVKESTASGWTIADEFVTGLKLAGPNFSQQKVIDGLNTLTNYSDNGFIQPVDWTKMHQDPDKHPDARGTLDCGNFVKVQGGKLVPVYDEPGKPWVCFGENDPNIDNPQHLSFAPAP
ncbi:MAG TPA: ABC transporter substrate-binding protein [Acidimicrobiia bacterium]|nr:ABC transporter substrate-binding protein [Acidimicrobiia bacterium]